MIGEQPLLARAALGVSAHTILVLSLNFFLMLPFAHAHALGSAFASTSAFSPPPPPTPPLPKKLLSLGRPVFHRTAVGRAGIVGSAGSRNRDLRKTTNGRSPAVVPGVPLPSLALTTAAHDDNYPYPFSEEKPSPDLLATRRGTFLLRREGIATPASVHRRRWRIPRVFSLWRPSKTSGDGKESSVSHDGLLFDYQFDELIIDAEDDDKGGRPIETVGVLLVHPIGVGIARWYFHRLFSSLESLLLADRRRLRRGAASSDDNANAPLRRYVFLAPDLLGSGTCSDPQPVSSSSSSAAEIQEDATVMQDGGMMRDLPLLNISDWTGQALGLMEEYESGKNDPDSGSGGGDDRAYEDRPVVDRWCVVANGGCSPIALQVAARRRTELLSSAEDDGSDGREGPSLTTNKPVAVVEKPPVTNVVLSAPPRLPFFLRSADPVKVAKSYRTLCGIAGRAFWWYSLRNGGSFVRKFSEKNLVARPENLGESWTPNCLDAARMYGGRSRYSTFAFLAGTLQDGCVASLDALKGGRRGGEEELDVRIDLIRGGDRQPNRAKSWFWEKPRKRKPSAEGAVKRRETLGDFLSENGNRAEERTIGGRISLAHEDSDGYAAALMDLIA